MPPSTSASVASQVWESRSASPEDLTLATVRAEQEGVLVAQLVSRYSCADKLPAGCGVQKFLLRVSDPLSFMFLLLRLWRLLTQLEHFFLVGALCLSAGHHLRLARGPAVNWTTTNQRKTHTGSKATCESLYPQLSSAVPLKVTKRTRPKQEPENTSKKHKHKKQAKPAKKQTTTQNPQKQETCQWNALGHLNRSVVKRWQLVCHNTQAIHKTSNREANCGVLESMDQTHGAFDGGDKALRRSWLADSFFWLQRHNGFRLVVIQDLSCCTN